MLITNSTHNSTPFYQFNGHLQTLIPGIFRKIKGVNFTRERINTDDGDFLDLDWVKTGAKQLAILTHGLEGSSNRQYIRGAVKFFNQNGYDALAWNCRSCSGEMNKAFRMYHHGEITDIAAIVNHAIGLKKYDRIVLLGFSMGANMTMKYLGVHGENVPKEVTGACVFSAPCDLEEAANVLDRWDNWIYRKKFLRALSAKIRAKDAIFPNKLDVSKLKDVKRWRDFDEWFAAPICGYRDAEDFYKNASAKYFIDGIRVPTLLVNALNDPILTPKCMPIEIAKNHPFFHLEMPKFGGHCGFMTPNEEFSWAEKRALEFLSTSNP
jgi:uncharacterized protein